MGNNEIASTTLMQTFAWVRRSCSDPVWVMLPQSAVFNITWQRRGLHSRRKIYSLLPACFAAVWLLGSLALVGGVTARCFCEIPGRVHT